jgi:hypothetical protein
MSVWRRKAVALFPERRGDFTQPKYSLARVLADLHSAATEAHGVLNEAGEAEDAPEALALLRRIHGYVEWCLHQKPLWASAAVGFYEDLFHTVPWEGLVPWLSPFAVEQIRQTWALGVGGEREQEFMTLLQSRRRELYRLHDFSTGVVQAL